MWLLLLLACADSPKDPPITFDQDGDGHVGEDDCDDADAGVWASREGYADADGDGFGDPTSLLTSCGDTAELVSNASDCDDADPDARPGATWYWDADLDGYGDPGRPLSQCDRPDGYVADNRDCDDNDLAIHPGAGERCDALDIDEDCNGFADNQDPYPLDGTAWYPDQDDDGWGESKDEVIRCEPPSGYVLDGGDCLDTDPDYHPGAPETDCADPEDYNCDGSVGYADADADGFAACEECDDATNTVSPAETERCNGVDDDCDGAADVGAIDASTGYPDQDGDGFGSLIAETSCEVSAATPTGDCDDDDATVSPAADERCDGRDDDCDGQTDEGALDAPTGHLDQDGDGWGEATRTTDCAVDPAVPDGDCDDADPSIAPDVSETCDGRDEDCDGLVDEDAGSIWVLDDLDGDGFGAGAPRWACGVGPAESALGGDCDDTDATVSPSAAEQCDPVGRDDDCDGLIDEDDPDAPLGVWYADADGDSFGDPLSGQARCAPGVGEGADASDCDDADSTVFPGAEERCDGRDEDCDGAVDEDALDRIEVFVDADGDRFGDPATPGWACTIEAGFAGEGTDCDDADAAVHVGAMERCNGMDDDCDAQVDLDDPDLVDGQPGFADADADGFGDPAAGALTCGLEPGQVSDDTDCDDADAAVFPGAPEVCNGYDDDCDGQLDDADPELLDAAPWYLDADADSYGDVASILMACAPPAGAVSDAQDCDDTRADVSPSGVEVCDPLDADEDCDGLVDDADPGVSGQIQRYADADADLHGDPAAPEAACDLADGYQLTADDCDDADPAVFPGALETCDGLDDDCDGLTDDEDPDVVGGTEVYPDLDGDGFGDPLGRLETCAPPADHVANGLDCDDTSTLISPDALEVCDAYDVDEDCDGVADELDDSVLGTSTYYLDRDGDGFGDPTYASTACDRPADHVSLGTDCDDTDAGISPSAQEICDPASGTGAATDEDCDGLSDDADPDVAGTTTWYDDEDADGYGDALAASRCVAPADTSTVAGDCDDQDPARSPGLPEICDDGLDNDCDQTVDPACALGSSASLAASTTRLIGEAVSGGAGFSVNSAGDTDGDGLDDLLIGAYETYGYATFYGRVYLVTSPAPGDLSLSAAGTTLVGAALGDALGFSVAGLGDPDDDGVIDLLVGAPGTDTPGSLAGAVYRVPANQTGTWSVTALAATTWVGEAGGDYLGTALDNAGDFDGDGLGDVLIGAYGNDDGGSSAGAAYVLPATSSGDLGTATMRFVGRSAADYTGLAVAGVGDNDGDGLDDVLVGAKGYDTGASGVGTAYLVLGGATGDISLSTCDARFVGVAAGDAAGGSVAAGDVDGDGLADLAIGAHGESSGGTESGAVYLLWGRQTGRVVLSAADTKLVGDTVYGAAGVSVSVGDTDADGLAEVLVGGAFYGSNDEGKVWRCAGSLTGTVALSSCLTLTGVGPTDHAGFSVAVMGDADGDAWGDLLIGAPGADTGSFPTGNAYFWSSGGL